MATLELVEESVEPELANGNCRNRDEPTEEAVQRFDIRKDWILPRRVSGAPTDLRERLALVKTQR